MKYLPVMGLEIHAELLCKTKIFCRCENAFGGKANTRVCPVCTGMPGSLPYLNKNAVKLAAKAGIVLNCDVNKYSAFDRKNYFYPDLPKSYQITQYYNPICSNGYIDLDNKRIRIERIHIEEDAGKLIHSDGVSLIDYNRCGVPLIEIVTLPDFSSASEIIQFMESIALKLKYADICDARLEQGSIRVDVNISLMEENSGVFGTRAEIKNLNSYKSIEKAVEYEINRQKKILDEGGTVLQETRRFNEADNTTVSMRIKELATDYRYFPEPDLPAVEISDDDINEIKNTLPIMPDIRLNTYVNKYKIPVSEALLIVKDKAFSDFFDETVRLTQNPLQAASIMLGELNRSLNISHKDISSLLFSPSYLAELINMIKGNIITRNDAKDIFRIMFETGEEPSKIAREKNYVLRDNSDEIKKIAMDILNDNPQMKEEYKNGNKKLFSYLFGQIMRKAGKGTNPSTVNAILSKILE